MDDSSAISMYMENDMESKITGTVDAWENKELGADPSFVKAVSLDEVTKIDEDLGLQMISIRLDKSLIESYKAIANFHGIGYQPLMRDALKRFAYHELRSIVEGFVKSQKSEEVKLPSSASHTKKASVKPKATKEAAKLKKAA